MEPAWEKVNGLKFQLVEYKDMKGELRPCYSLTKTECLYIATKFNDEARAKLALRWEQLEGQELARRQQRDECLQTPYAIVPSIPFNSFFIPFHSLLLNLRKLSYFIIRFSKGQRQKRRREAAADITTKMRKKSWRSVIGIPIRYLVCPSSG